MSERETSEKGLTTSHAVGEGTIRDYHLTLTVGEGNILKKELPPHALVGEGTIGDYHLTLIVGEGNI